MKRLIYLILLVSLSSIVYGVSFDCVTYSCNQTDYKFSDFSNPANNSKTVSDNAACSNGDYTQQGSCTYQDTFYFTAPVSVEVTNGNYPYMTYPDMDYNTSCLDIHVTTKPSGANKGGGGSWTAAANQIFPKTHTVDCPNINNWCYWDGSYTDTGVPITNGHNYTACVYWDGSNSHLYLVDWEAGTDFTVTPSNAAWTGGTFTPTARFQFPTEEGTFYLDNLRMFYGSFANKDIGILAAAPPSPDTPANPQFIPPTPHDNEHNNTLPKINCSHNSSGVNFYLYVDNTTIYYNITGNYSYGVSYNVSSLSEGTHTFKCSVQNTTNGLFSNNISRTFVYDTLAPTITRETETLIFDDNSSIISKYHTNLSIKFTFEDDNLYKLAINITNSSDDSVFQFNYTASLTSYTYTNSSIPITDWALGNYSMRVEATDSHTTKKIKDYDVTKDVFNTWIEYDTIEGEHIRVEVISENWIDINGFDTTKLDDRYTFELDLKKKPETLIFHVTCENEIDIIEDSIFPAHFVCGHNWVDFNENDIDKVDISATLITPHLVEVTLTNIKKSTFYFNSIGGLNYNRRDYEFKIGSVLDFYAYDDTIDKLIEINVSSNDGYFDYIRQGNSTSPARFNNVTMGNRSFIISSSGYENLTIYHDIIEPYYNLTYNITPIGVRFYFYDEVSGTLIGGNETFSIYLQTTGFSNTYSTDQNPYIVTGLGVGTYRTKVSSTNYPQREYFGITITDATGDIVNVYLINDSGSEEIAFNVVDSSSNDIQDVFVTFLRSVGGGLIVVGEEETDFAGTCRLNLDTNYEYTINFSKTGYDDKEITLEPNPADSPYTVQLSSGTGGVPIIIESYEARNILFNLTYTNTTKEVLFEWNDIDDVADFYCLSVRNFETTFSSECVDINSSSLTYTLVDQNQTVTTYGYVIIGDNFYTLDSIDINLIETWQELGTDTVLITLVLFLVFTLIGLYMPEVSISLGIVSLVGAMLMGLLPIGLSTIIGLIFVSIVIFMGIKKSKE